MIYPTRFIAALLFLFIAAACDKTTEETSEEKRTFPVTTPIVIDTISYTYYVADIQSLKNVEIRARVKGYMDKIHVDEGERVRQGQLLFSISSQEYREAVLQANAALKSAIAEAKSAELNLENVKILVANNTVSAREKEIAQAKLEALQAKVEEARAHEATARLHLSYTEIRAPFDGIIDRIPYKVGSLIDEGSLLTTLSDNSQIFAYFNISEKEYLDFSQNAAEYADEKDDVRLILVNDADHPHSGKIETIEGEFDRSVGNIAIRARFPNPERILKHGATGKVRVQRHLNKVMVVPQKSTFEIQDRTFVYVLDAQNQVRIKSFEPGQRIPHLFVVASGLSSKDKIIYEGIQDIREGMTIQPAEIPMRTIISQLAKE